MPSFNIIRKSESRNSFRVEAVKGMFDLENNEIIEIFKGNISLENLSSWNVGLIYGDSGTGKTTISTELFGKSINYKYKNNSVIEDMPNNQLVENITKIFNSVGFASVPSWLKPYDVLSTGEQMRINLARAILDNRKLIVFDEFTSTVNRAVAKISSFAVQKAVRRMNKQFIAVTCHYDIIDWLEPDWTFCTNNMSFQSSKKKDQRLKLNLGNVQESCGRCLRNIII